MDGEMYFTFTVLILFLFFCGLVSRCRKIHEKAMFICIRFIISVWGNSEGSFFSNT